VTRAIKKHAADFAAIIAMSALAIGVAAYILINQDARPSIPLLEPKPVKIEAEFSDAQAVVPGQGQSVRVAGVQIGKISDVQVEDGLAVVSMDIEQKYGELVRQDASALLRPRTGLKDMFVELDPGSQATPPLGEGGRISVENTAPDIDPDEILAALDTDTRSYLQLLVNGLGKGLQNNGDDLREVFSRFEPLHRDLAKVQGAFASRREALSRLIHNYGELTTELAKSPDDLRRLVTASNDVFEAFASEDQRISETISLLPGALNQTETTLTKVDRLSQVLGPTLDDLRPAFRQLDVANREVLPLVTQGEPILRNQIRPFVRRARPYVRDLRPTAIDLARATPELTTSFGELNRFFNMLAFNPAGQGEEDERRPRTGAEPCPGCPSNSSAANDNERNEGYLFWLHWVTTNSNSVFSTSDASGPFRRGLFQANCETVIQEVEHAAHAFEEQLPPPLKPLGETAAEAVLTIAFGQNPVSLCSLIGGGGKVEAALEQSAEQGQPTPELEALAEDAARENGGEPAPGDEPAPKGQSAPGDEPAPNDEPAPDEEPPADGGQAGGPAKDEVGARDNGKGGAG
jgi:phospholipid/cholesterol/gamma-HCH transport system substrate-binding protein